MSSRRRKRSTPKPASKASLAPTYEELAELPFLVMEEDPGFEFCHCYLCTAAMELKVRLEQTYADEIGEGINAV